MCNVHRDSLIDMICWFYFIIIFLEKFIRNKSSMDSWQFYWDNDLTCVQYKIPIRMEKFEKATHHYTAACNFFLSLSDPIRLLWNARRYAVLFLLGQFHIHSYRLRLLLLLSLPRLIVSLFFVSLLVCIIPFHSDFTSNKWKIIVDCLCFAVVQLQNIFCIRIENNNESQCFDSNLLAYSKAHCMFTCIAYASWRNDFF